MIPREKQTGATLIVGLVLLLVVTLLGVSVMNSSTLELKISNNSAQKAYSFEEAESARDAAKKTADAIAASLNATPTVFPTPGAGVYNVGGPGTTVTSPAVETEGFWTASPAKYATSGSSAKYVVEYLGKELMELDGNRNTGTTTELHVFRLTMRGLSAAKGDTAIQAVYVTN